ncbi:hypothetical protein FA13DRAFT_1802091 [Coprinellus micaceus]|uniref:Uncharacterized protein n=1 Tax=Coprinellus micaceus TaxID=71717 RepID=A0A4Y7SDC5_COPMI|nr:hypothetical protein FA13DRAFT_1802091 [Coprinellus micaceus]
MTTEMEDEYDDGSGPPPVAKQPRGTTHPPPTSLDVRFETCYLPSLNTSSLTALVIALHSLTCVPHHAQMKRLLPSRLIEHALTALGVPSSLLGDLSEVERANVVDAVGTLLLAGKRSASSIPVRSLQLPSRGISPRWRPLRSTEPPQDSCRLRLRTLRRLGHEYRPVRLGRSETKLESQWWGPRRRYDHPRPDMPSGAGEVRPIARYLIQQGIAFQIALLTHLEGRPTVCRVARQGAGSYTDDDPFTREDYQRYEERLNAFLASRRGALALRCVG